MKLKANLKYFAFLSLRLLLWALAIFFLLLIISLISTWRHWRDFGQNAIAGKDQLSGAVISLRAKDWDGAQSKLQAAQTYFQNGQKNLESLRQSWFPAKLKLGGRQIDDLGYLNNSALIISSSALQVNALLKNISANTFADDHNFQSLSQEKKAAFMQSLIALEPELNGLKANLSLALFNLDKIQTVGILWPLRGQIVELRNQIADGENILSESLPIIRLLPAFSGYPQTAHYLIMLQNNDELRPTGGFLGSYVRADIADFGEFQKLEASDIYHLDMPAIGKTAFTAPEPISKYLQVDNWYLRDANWSPDWPQSARQIQNMFQAESAAGGQAEPSLDGVLAITPDFVANLLRLTGPITVRGESYAPENMQALLQYNVEVAYKEEDISSWDRKDIINELIQALKEKLISLPLEQYPELISRLNTSLKRGDILLYFNNPDRQALAQSLGGGGEIKQVSGDYLMVVDANLAAFKSDAVMQKNIAYQVEKKTERLQASLKLDYYHNGGFDWRTTRYRSYTRVLAPLGSELIKLSGLGATEADIISYDDDSLQKHVFGFFWSIEPGKSKTINLEYYLPVKLNDNLSTNNVYTLYIQRQPGSRIANLSVYLNPGKEIVQISPQSLEGEIKSERAYFTLDLNTGSQALQIKTAD
ncbi:MAG: DUF4012 domain-containing protein [Patescibacteria group bacterium]|nr:DUF4012 domain-containing protein [Patescibacteria group bacterium]